MKRTFLGHGQPMVMVMVYERTLERAANAAARAMAAGADAVGIQIEIFSQSERTPTGYRRLFAAAGHCPVYVTNYRETCNLGLDDESIARGIMDLAQNGATLCDVTGDLFDPQPGQMTYDLAAVARQKDLINDLHSAGAEVLMSSHIHRFMPAEQIIDIALRQQERGADIVKIVAGAETMAQQIENLRITALLKETLSIPYLFLSTGVCGIHRRIGPMLGNCMWLSVLQYGELEPRVQPLLPKLQGFLDNFDWEVGA